MIRAALVWLIIFLSALTSAAQQGSQISFGTPDKDENYPMIQLSNGNFLFAGATTHQGAGGKDVLVTVTDSLGQIIWSKQYGGTGDETALSVCECSNGDLVLGGESFSADTDGDAFLFRVTSAGTLLWWKNYGGTLYDITYSVIEIPGGELVAAGLTEVALLDYDAFLFKTDASGNILWQNVIGRAGIEHAVNVIQTADNGFIFCGKALSVGQGYCDCWFVKTDSNGDTLWTSTVGGQGWDESMDIIEVPGGYVACGGSNSEGFSNYDYILMRIDSVGNLIWVKQYGGVNVEDSYCVKDIPGTGYALAGYTETFSYSNTRGSDSANAWVVLTDYNGDTLRNWVYGGNQKEECFSIEYLGGMRFAFSGYTASAGDSLQVYFYRTDSIGATGCNERPTQPHVLSPSFVTGHFSFNISQSVTTTSYSALTQNSGAVASVDCQTPLTIPEPAVQLISFNNPATNTLEINSQVPVHTLEIYNSQGQLVQIHNAENNNAGSFHLSAPPGLYILKFRLTDGGEQFRKLLIR
jgi:hypothetical protein